MHEKDEIIKAAHALAQTIVNMEQQKHDGVDNHLICHSLDVAAQQSRMLLKELDGENFGDA